LSFLPPSEKLASPLSYSNPIVPRNSFVGINKMQVIFIDISKPKKLLSGNASHVQAFNITFPKGCHKKIKIGLNLEIKKYF